MKNLTLALVMTLASAAMADQKTPTVCTGKNIILETRTPYLGENSRFSQTLYVLKSVQNDNESSYTAFFLSVTTLGMDSQGMLHQTGRNEVGGSFHLRTSAPVKSEKGALTVETSKGILTYSHGVLKGEEAVTCETEMI